MEPAAVGKEGRRGERGSTTSTCSTAAKNVIGDDGIRPYVLKISEFNGSCRWLDWSRMNLVEICTDVCIGQVSFIRSIFNQKKMRSFSKCCNMLNDKETLRYIKPHEALLSFRSNNAGYTVYYGHYKS